MEIRDVLASLREQCLELRLEQASLRSQVNLLERFTWNLLTDLRRAVDAGLVEFTWTMEDEDTAASTVDSTVDSPERTDPDANPTLF